MIYTYTVLRYIHDCLTEEFVTVMVVVLCDKQIHCRMLNDYKRIGQFFPDLDTKFLQTSLEQIHDRLCIQDTNAKDIGVICNRLLTKHESGLQWSPHVCGGITQDIEMDLEKLSRRFLSQSTNTVM